MGRRLGNFWVGLVVVLVVGGLGQGCTGRRGRGSLGLDAGVIATDAGGGTADGAFGVDAGPVGCDGPDDCAHLTDACGTARCDGEAGVCVRDVMDCSHLDGACVTGECNPSTGACEPIPAEEESPCDDGDACSRGDYCAAGECVSGCDGLAGQCNTGICNAETGECDLLPVDDGTTCDDESPCTSSDRCSDGACVGAERDCSGLDDECNAGECDPSTGSCEAVPVSDGTSCDDGDACTMGDQCVMGDCASGDMPDCGHLDDDCNAGECNPSTGRCRAVPVTNGTSCSDGDSCTTPDTCQAGVCGGPNTCCGLQDLRINEVFGDSPDFIEIINTGTCSLDLDGVTIRFHYDNSCSGDGETGSHTFAPRMLASGAVIRIIDSTSYGVQTNEIYFGSNMCDTSDTGGWFALCDGACSTSSCTNYLDYVEKSDDGARPVGAPTCASFTPAPVDVSAGTASWSINRIGSTGSGRSGRAADWRLSSYSRD